jgi:hypothetical protein
LFFDCLLNADEHMRAFGIEDVSRKLTASLTDGTRANQLGPFSFFPYVFLLRAALSLTLSATLSRSLSFFFSLVQIPRTRSSWCTCPASSNWRPLAPFRTCASPASSSLTVRARTSRNPSLASQEQRPGSASTCPPTRFRRSRGRRLCELARPRRSTSWTPRRPSSTRILTHRLLPPRENRMAANQCFIPFASSVGSATRHLMRLTRRLWRRRRRRRSAPKQ